MDMLGVTRYNKQKLLEWRRNGEKYEDSKENRGSQKIYRGMEK